MRLVILEDSERVAEWTARYIRSKIVQFKPSADKYFVLGLPTGSTPLGTYKRLVEMVKKGELSFQFVKSFNMDEYVGIPRDHSQSYHSFMFQNLFSHIDIHPSNVHILDGNAADLVGECDKFEEEMRKAGGVDLFVGGLGADGHIAFNEPASSLASLTRIKTLNQETITANARFFEDDIDKVPRQALTVGVATVMAAREVMIITTGVPKALALHKVLEEGVNHMWTASVFQQHPRCTFVCDEDATMELKVKTVKYFKDLMTIHNKLIDEGMDGGSEGKEGEKEGRVMDGGSEGKEGEKEGRVMEGMELDYFLC